VNEQPSPIQTQAPQPPLDESTTATILVVDDVASVRLVASTILRRTGYTVLEASTPAEAMRLVDWHRGVIDLLLTDVYLGTMTGTALAKCSRSARPMLGVLFFSGFGREYLIDIGDLPSDAMFLAKPFRLTELVDRVRDLLREQSRTSVTRLDSPSQGDTLNYSAGVAPAQVAARL
jgi:DNA-binding NtrC family response regulator